MTTTNKSSMRFYYLRQEQDVYRYDENGAFMRMVRAKTPIALIGSVVDRKANTVSFAVSIAHPKDCFNKHMARRMVNSHLQKKPFTIAIPNKATAHEINSLIMKAILSDEECELFAKKLNRDQGITDGAGYKNVLWVNSRFKHQRLRRLASKWLARPRWEEKSDLIQTVKDAIAKNPDIKTDPKLLVDFLQTTGLLDERFNGVKELLSASITNG